jgi:hypothetical protein
VDDRLGVGLELEQEQLAVIQVSGEATRQAQSERQTHTHSRAPPPRAPTWYLGWMVVECVRMAMSASNSQLACGRTRSSTSTMPLRTEERLAFFRASAAVWPATTCGKGEAGGRGHGSEAMEQ